MQSLQFHLAVATWFERTFGTPTEPQQLGWPAIQSGAHTLVAAPTGSGKTLAAFLASLNQLYREGLDGTLADETRVLYVSPLKALSNDIHKNLDQPLTGIRSALRASCERDIDIRAEVRTGDTPAAKRQAIIRKPPHILVTTPESLYLLLTSVSGRKLLRTVRTLILDEIHAVVSNRRGSHLALSVERLAALTNHPLQRIGLSATQKPMEEVARFLVGTKNLDEAGNARCRIVDCGHTRKLDLAIELPGSPLDAVMSNEVWAEVYNRLADLVEAHRTTLVFVNTRRLAERVTHHLCERLGKDQVTSHHGSLSAKLRLDAENRLKRGELKALVATASLELGIDIGSIDLVCQLGPTRSIATFLQRVGRAEHRRGGLPKGRLFPLSRDELVEGVATLRSIRKGELDLLEMPQKPLDLLSQQIVACAACEDLDESALFDLTRSAYPYRNLTRKEFGDVLRMLADGFGTRRGRRSALIHHDGINHRVRPRRGARLLALTSGGAIPDNADYRVVVEPSETFVGTVNEDFAVESMAGDIFQLGNASWRILGINSGTVRVEDAHGQPPGIPFWLGEAPSRTAELSRSVSRFRGDVEKQLSAGMSSRSSDAVLVHDEPLERRPDEQELVPTVTEVIPSVTAWIEHETGLSQTGAIQLADYFTAVFQSLGVIPSQDKLVLERFFDESGGMQLVIHSPFGNRLNRAWGLALRKRFCRSFNFELQAAATDDAIVLSLGTQHSFPLDDVFHYLNSKTVRDILIQALLDAPMFGIRWRWNAGRSLALPRQRAGRRVPAPLQRMESENLLAAIFPDQLACLENIAGDREIPEHPLVQQTIDDCLVEAMDIEGLIRLLERIEKGEIECIARDLPEPSPLAHEILNAKPYAFLDNAPLEERRTQAVYTRRVGEASADGGLGILDANAIEKVCVEAWPQATSADELHETLLLVGVLTDDEVRTVGTDSSQWLAQLVNDKRAGRIDRSEPWSAASLARPTRSEPLGRPFWIAAERLPMLRAVYPDCKIEPLLVPPASESERHWQRADAIRELVRGRMEVIGPITATKLASLFQLPVGEINTALAALEGEGFVLRGKFHPDAQELEWCDRRLLARIHRLTLNRLRAEIQPVSIAELQRFLLAWQRVEIDHRAEGLDGVRAVLELLDGFELPAAAWEPEVLVLRVKEYQPAWLDQLCFTGRFGWGRLTAPQKTNGRPPLPVRSSPISLFSRENLPLWLTLSAPLEATEFSPDTTRALEVLAQGGALFFGELVQKTGLLPSRLERALAELTAQGLVTADSFEGLRALLVPEEKRAPFASAERRRHHKAVTSLEFAGRWSLLRTVGMSSRSSGTVLAQDGGSDRTDERELIPTVPGATREQAVEAFARVLLRRYGVVFRRILEQESLRVTWFELVRVYRTLEARGEIRGGHFVAGISGEQYALPEAVGLLRTIRKNAPKGDLIPISAADPLNLTGVLTLGLRVAAISAHRVLLRDGVPTVALKAGQLVPLTQGVDAVDQATERALKIGSMPAALRPYYA
ncbi:MAG TPA: DEAD/DEAH box helicase [Chthoniobacterales bacterium]|nr:DEAD/DEAH box helicase [Chthoniobacterales bacterium]